MKHTGQKCSGRIKTIIVGAAGRDFHNFNMLYRGDSSAEVIAFTAECPHLGCAINLSADGKSFLCPCHASAFDFDGKPRNQVPPRPMDRLDVELTAEPDPKVRVKFQRFRTLAQERIPLA